VLLVLITGCTFTPGTPSPSPGTVAPDIDAPAAVDPWPCGTMPEAPPGSLDMQLHGGTTYVRLSSIVFAGGSPVLVAAPGSAISLHFDYAINDTACPNDCRDQIEIGFVAGERIGCLFDDAVPHDAGTTGHVDQTISAPSAPGAYDLRVNVGQNYSCTYGGANAWWGQTPGTTQAIAKLCVH
jgi:hypothetical protein